MPNSSHSLLSPASSSLVNIAHTPSAADATANPGKYIHHHLTNLHSGEGFWAINWDTLVISWILAAILIFAGWLVGRRINNDHIDTDVPHGIQNLLETVVEFVEQQVGEIFMAATASSPPFP